MEWESFTTDQIEQILISVEERVSAGRAMQLAALEELDRRQVATCDGSRNLSEWLTARCDLGTETARSLVRTMRRTVDLPHLRDALEAGSASFDRVEALSKIGTDVGTLAHLDVAGVHRRAADGARILTDDERRSATVRFLVMQPSLDESWWKLSGGLDGHSGAIVDKVLTDAADHLPDLPESESMNLGWRKATALTQLCVADNPPPANVTVFIDADLAVRSDGQAGVRLEAGPRVGVQALSSILCDAVTEVTVNGADGVPMAYGRASRSIPPRLRRAILARTGGYCAADGCNSRYRVEAHHIIGWSRGGPTDPDNLVALCWFHHHVVVHERGFEVFEDPEHGRIRFRKPSPVGRQKVIATAGRRQTKG